MDFSAALGSAENLPPDAGELRAAPRYTTLIRAAKLVSAQGEFVCVIRDVSATGISVKTFHHLPNCDAVALETQNGDTYELVKVRSGDHEAAFTFAEPVNVDQLIHENWKFRKRQLRLKLAIPLWVSTISGRFEAATENMSQQGAMIECDTRFAIDQLLRIEGAGLPEIRAKVRWRKANRYGLVFENTFSLRDFALAAASMQCPSLVATDL